MTDVNLPQRINRLDELANNLWWSWHEEARNLFRALDYPLWRLSGHNPVKELREVGPDILQKAASDPTFLVLYDSVMTNFDNDLSTPNTWIKANHADLLKHPIAYFSMEYAIHNSLPLYAGGLGILAGDICKEMSDLGLPMIAVGFMYPQGYFHQHIGADGWQQEIYRQLDFEEAPISPIITDEGKNRLAGVKLGDVDLAIGAWLVRVGRTNIYLMDTNLEDNPPQYRELISRLYIADPEVRLQQEIVLGIGGVRILHALNIKPVIWHANEGHTAFMMLERVKEEVDKGKSFSEAMSSVQSTTVFTTHTPVKAGHDVFPVQLMEKYFGGYWQSLGIDQKTFYQLGQQDGSEPGNFNMTVLALKMADRRCAVSQLHGQVTRKMWHRLWPDMAEEQVPIVHITNGIHVSSWVAPELGDLFEKYLGKDWVKEHDNPRLWDRILDIPNAEIWAVRQQLERKLVGAIRERIRRRWIEGDISLEQVIAMGTGLDPDTLTIAFTRRFTEYKRPMLIFQDVERLKRILTNPQRPVQLIFAGKSHPADMGSKHILQQVFNLATDPEFQGRIAFVEDYDMHIARYLVHGVDVWLNNPRRLHEASGTSGMKASLNGALHLSILDGWWYEAYNGNNGWAIGTTPGKASHEEEDREDAEALYHLLEGEIVPLYYDQDRSGIPHNWILMVKEAIRSTVPAFCARRMLKEYIDQMYQPANRLIQ